MAIEYAVLASGSSGNSLWVRGEGVELLVDCGLSLRRLTERLAAIGRDVRDVQAVICTHLHGDHIGGIGPLLRATGARVIGTAPTLDAIRAQSQRTVREPLPEALLQTVDSRAELRVGGLTVQLAPTPHDAPESVAVVVRDRESAVGIVTDLGQLTETVVKHLSGLDGLVLEMNHDPEMLERGPYPDHLKRRIRGGRGHLSNAQGAELLGRVLHPGLQHLALAHLSEANNLPDLARAAAEGVLMKRGGRTRLEVAAQDVAGTPIRLFPKRGQLSLAF